MDVELRYRTELADQFIERVAHLTAVQWHEVVAHHATDDPYHRLAVELVGEASQLIGIERAPLFELAMRARDAQLAQLLDALAEDLTPPVRATAKRLATSAMHAIVMRDASGFNAGAFRELTAPFASYVDLPDVERTATRIVTPPGVARQPEADPPR